MARVFLCEVLPKEHVAQVAAAGATFDLRPLTVGIRQPVNSSWDFFVKGWPATTGVELIN